MKTISPRRQLTAALVFALALAPARASEIVSAGHVPVAAGPIVFGPRINAGLDSIVAGLSLRSNEELLSGIEALTKAYLKEGALEQRLALAALTQPAAEAQRIIAGTDLSKATAERLSKIVQKAAKAAGKGTDFAQALAAARSAAETTKPKIAADETAIAAAVDAFMAGKAAETTPLPDAPTPVEGKTGTSPTLPPGSRPAKAGEIAGVPEGRPVLSYGQAALPLIAYPSEGADISALWRQAQAQGPALLQAQYNFDDMEMAKAIVAASKAGQKQVIVGDYSNWFPDKLSQTNHGGKHSARTEAMQYLIDNMNPNIELYILKGLGSIGINHNKFSVFSGARGELLQGGSFNYTGTSQKNHWENVVFTSDQERIDWFKKYHAWLVRRARRFSEDLEPEDPKMDPADPIPAPPVSKDVALHGVPFPKAAFSPNGGGEDKLVQAEALVTETLDILMFSPFPTPKMVVQIQALLKAGRKVRMIADAGQVERAALLVPLIRDGMQMKTIVGPDVVLRHEPRGDHSKQHEKVMIFDGRTPSGMVKMGDSLNISRNALEHNFENIQFWMGIYVAIEQAHFDSIWELASEMSGELLAKLEQQFEQQRAKGGARVHEAANPWLGEDPTAAQPAPAGR